MIRDHDRARMVTRRAAVLGGGKLLLLSALVGRMYYLQVVEADRYRMLAEENRISMRLVAPPRGRIFDRNGVPLAVNEQNFRVLVVLEQARNLDATLDALSRVIPLTAAERARIHREVRKRRSFVPVKVRENLSWEDVARIEVNMLDMPGVTIDVGQSRSYPAGRLAAHVVGYVAAVSEKDLTGDPLLELPGFRIGKAGVERVYDLALRGSGGTRQVEVNALGRVIRELSRDEGEPGHDLTLTLDMEIQAAAMKRLEGESAAAVVMDVHTGELLALASTPSFDPNAFNRGLSFREWKALVDNPRAPLTNKAIAGQYAPGSTFKPMVAMAALEDGIVTSKDRFFCGGHIELGDTRFHCWKRGGHGWMNLHDALKHSCDIYFYEVSRRVGIDRIAEMARRFGLGEETGIDLPGERGGNVPTKEWKRGALGQPWHLGETLVNGIGQGFVLTTPLQLAVMTARIANGGQAVTPHVVRARPATKEEAAGKPAEKEDEVLGGFSSLGVSRSALAAVKAGLEAVTNELGGTAYLSRIREPGMEMAGKTGTAQVRRITLHERRSGVRDNDELPWRERDHALFIAYAPVDAPRFAAAVVVEHGGSGSRAAAPIARDLLLETQRRHPRPVAVDAARARGEKG